MMQLPDGQNRARNGNSTVAVIRDRVVKDIISGQAEHVKLSCPVTVCRGTQQWPDLLSTRPCSLVATSSYPTEAAV